MKTKNKKEEGKIQPIQHVIVPFGGPEGLLTGEVDFFDDCPLCQQLRRDLESGAATYGGEIEWEAEPVRWEDLEKP